MDQVINQTIEEIFQGSSRVVFASLVRLLGDFDLAEDALQDAFALAMTQWNAEGIPENPALKRLIAFAVVPKLARN
jgi:RNA polymerase sigma-70 factor, ECF subfamily